MHQLSAEAVRRRFLVLTALRWLPVGLLFPLLALLPIDRGLTLSQVGLAFAVQGVVVLALELPTGGLADAMGRRPVLLLAGVIGLGSLGLMFFADTFAAFAVSYGLQGVYRALDSGPLEAWFVDSSLEADSEAPIERGLSAAGVVTGVSISAGSLLGGGLIALGGVGPVEALAVPIVVALLVKIVDLVAVALLVREARPARGTASAARAALDTPKAIADGVRLLRHSPVLLSIVAVELFWGFGMVAYEGLFPMRLAELLADTQRAAVITGPAASAAWLASAAGAACVPWLGRRYGMARTAMILRVLHGATVALMGLFAGVIGVVIGYLAGYTIHGAAGPAHMTLLHRQVTGAVRATAVSLDSMVSQPAGALGAVALTALADGTSVSVAILVGAAVLAAATPLYLPAFRQERDRHA